MAKSQLDFDGDDARQLVNEMMAISVKHQQPREAQWAKEYNAFHGFRPGNNRDRSNFRHQKVAETVMTKSPNELNALFGLRPWFPLEPNDKQQRASADDFQDTLDKILAQGDFFGEAVLANMMKTTYGLSYLEPIPRFKKVKQKVRVPELMGGVPVSFHEEEQEQLLFSIDTVTRAPWEVKIDPHAVSLERPEAARWAIVVEFVSRHQMYQAAKNGTTRFPDWDYEKLQFKGPMTGQAKRDHETGRQMIQQLGLRLDFDDDIMLLFRCMTPYRYIDLLDGEHVLRDRPNPHDHGMINLTRWSHVPDIHTLNRFCGIGEAKPIIPMVRFLDDLKNLAMDNAMVMQQPVMLYNSSGGVDPKQLVRSLANRIPIEVAADKTFSHYVEELPGRPLPPDMYIQSDSVDSLIDRRTFTPPPMRSESLPEGRTATEVAGMFDSAEKHNSIFLALSERVAMHDFGSKCLHLMAQNMTIVDYSHYLGLDRALAMQYHHPDDIPNGWDFAFKGSGRMMRQAIVQRTLKELSPEISTNPVANPAVWLEILCEAHSDVISEEDKRRLIMMPGGAGMMPPMPMGMEGQLGAPTPPGQIQQSSAPMPTTQNTLEAQGTEQVRGMVA